MNFLKWVVSLFHPQSKLKLVQSQPATVTPIVQTPPAPPPSQFPGMPYMNWMISNIGQPEVTGQPATAFDQMVFSHTDYGPLINNTMDSGCAATACAALELTGYASPHSAMAVSFCDYGTPCTLQPGCIVVFDFGGGDHHVAFCYEVIGSSYVKVIGGNQNHVLGINTYGQQYIIATRMPVLASA